MTQRILVVDDEELGRQRIVRMVSNIANAEVIGEASGGVEAITKARAMEPDLLLLDIEMPDLTGLEVAAVLGDLAPIVFVTAYDQYAIEAFEKEAVDYLVKPVKAERLATAIQRASKRGATSLEALQGPRGLMDPSLHRVVATHNNKVEIFDATTITRFWAQDKYTWFLANGQEQMTEERLDSLENRLAPAGFARVHRSELVRVDAIRSIERDAAGTSIGMSDGQVAQVSRRRVTALRKLLGI